MRQIHLSYFLCTLYPVHTNTSKPSQSRWSRPVFQLSHHTASTT